MNCWELADLKLFDSLAYDIGKALLKAPEVNVGKWQSQDVRGRPEMVSYELSHTRLMINIDTPDQSKLAIHTGASMPWAEDHFLERISGKPLNPPPSEAWWPYAVQGNAAHKADEKFSHTYPERFWPRFANEGNVAPNGRQVFVPHMGVRYAYGDLQDVVNLLVDEPYTRQAYLPVWFPEDTGAVKGQRVPCTLGYHFLMRDGVMDIEYHIRSCDYMRHWRDDVYMAGRLLQWVCARIKGTYPGKLVMNIGSFHIFQGDRDLLTQQLSSLKKKQDAEKYSRIVSAL